ncbi:hypothetical protein GUJ93_ZPchr0010g9044 [Zizania palustris]|uniref:Uncharacterized protein n=1 Tax=Zizania palustris TaxID=103762 RepID=A0A8J5W189_ZIZPA|nr:hypothetical protein GUJ93_ZPchr0010g9044 [Zizania palustris]
MVRGIVLVSTAQLMSLIEPPRVPLRLPNRALSALLHAHAIEDTALAIVFQLPVARLSLLYTLRLSMVLAPVPPIASRMPP